MGNERKKAELKPVIKPVVPKKREVIEEPEKKETVTSINKEEKKRKSDSFKTIRIALNADIEERKHISERVQKGELTLAYYAIDGENSYHYYFVNKI